jgi:hypothetical protein
MNPQHLYDLLNRALTEELGLAVETNNPTRLSNEFHAITKDNEKYSSLVITVPGCPDHVFISKRTIDLHEPIYDEPDLD